MFRLVQPPQVWCDLGKGFACGRYLYGVEVCVVACNGLALRKNSAIVCCHLSGLGQSPAYIPGLGQKQQIFQCFKCKLPLLLFADMLMWNGCHYEIAKYCAKRGKEEKHDKTANFYARPLPPMPVLLHGKHLGILIKGFALVMFSLRSPIKEWIQDLSSSACTSRKV